MKQFACGDVVPGCDATFTAETDDAIVVAVRGHAAEVHGISELPRSILAQVVDGIRALE